MTFELKALPFAEDALEPYISKQTIQYHYHKHHQGYVDKLNNALKSSEHNDITNLGVLIKVADGTLYNLAAQVWNHDFYWQSLAADGGGNPPQYVAEYLQSAFGSVDKFREQFRESAKNEFGSGWTWLSRKPAGGLEIASTTDAVNPLSSGKYPIVTLDVWEHAYYLDYQNARPEYIDAFLDHLINWEFVEANLRENIENSATRNVE